MPARPDDEIRFRTRNELSHSIVTSFKCHHRKKILIQSCKILDTDLAVLFEV